MLVAGKKLLLVKLLFLLAVCVCSQNVVEKKESIEIKNCPAICTCVLKGGCKCMFYFDLYLFSCFNTVSRLSILKML